tara:strand:+ start:1863 stop:2888 length:1026 start_codon:yes stop_codon:yes gene_type:complete
MTTLFQRLQITPSFLALIFLFAYLDSIRSRVAPGQRIDWYTLTPESAVLSLLQAIVIFLILQHSFSWLQVSSQVSIPWKKSILSFVKGLIFFLVLSNVFTLILALGFGTWERNYQTDIQISANISRILDFVIYGGFYVALLLFRQFKLHQTQLNDYEIALAESKITHLKQQLNPHFLFNNLNILDQLIEENPKSASAFLQNFSELYRYTLQNSDSRLVSWQDELEFAENYFHLIGEKFGESYQMKITIEKPEGKLPPLTMQLLIENAVFHNYGTVENPVQIHIILGNQLTVTNSLIPFKNPRHKGGKGLTNLREQYRILTKEKIQVKNDNGLFSVSIPLIP